FSIALALKERNNQVIYFAGYRAPTDLFKRHEIEKACDVVVWSTDRGPGIPIARPQDRRFLGNIVEAGPAPGAGRPTPPAAGPRVPGKHRRGDARLRPRPARRAADPAGRGAAHHR